VSKTFKKITKVLVKGDLGHQAAKSMGLPDPAGDLIYGDNKALTPAEQNAKMQKQQMEQATKASEAAMRQQAEFDAQAQRLASNQAGLTGDNAAKDTTKFDVGGMDSPDTILDDMRKRRGKATTSLQLGIS
jgi:hypothetical protein